MIDPETLSHLIELASFEFEPGQADYLRDQMNRQLKTIDELAAVPIDETVPTRSTGSPTRLNTARNYAMIYHPPFPTVSISPLNFHNSKTAMSSFPIFRTRSWIDHGSLRPACL